MTPVAPYPNGGIDIELESKRNGFQSQVSTIANRRQQAVCVRNACKRYGSKKDPVAVLDGLNMTVAKGSIYGLLGASGCGKTTLLNCIVGRRKLNSGDVWVLGGKPGERGTGVPGSRLGFMPQEVALYGEFTIRETLFYFGMIVGMSRPKIDMRIHELSNLLLLPNVNSMVNTLSGGQQRRVSLSAALIHEPELLILDEPTVGVDPLLRQNIWNYLLRITEGGQTTVIITTHYIDETRQATTIGLMRGGYFLAEESPSKLLSSFGCDTLEAVFLKLSEIQSRAKHAPVIHGVMETVSLPIGINISDEILDGTEIEPAGSQVSLSCKGDNNKIISKNGTTSGTSLFAKFSNGVSSLFLNKHHMKALVWKDFLWFWRNIPIMLFLIGLPIVQIVLFCTAIGHDPTELSLAVVDYELDWNETCNSELYCDSPRLSCAFLDYLTKGEVMKLKYYSSEAEARHTVLHGNSHASVVFQSNYSDALRERIAGGNRVADGDIFASNVEFFRDLSNKHIATYLMFYAYKTFQNFVEDFSESCGYSRKLFNLPIQNNAPIYGEEQPNFTDFAAPGIVITTIFFLSVGLTAIIMLTERNEGTLERSFVIGITSTELLFAHAVTLFFVMLIQITTTLGFAFQVFRLTLKGSVTLVVLSNVLSGMSGMSCGFVISSVCDSERTATYAAMGALFPMIILCGILWPIEGLQTVLAHLVAVLPLTNPTEALRAIMARGWDMSAPVVYWGFITQFVWVLIFLTISVLVLKLKHS